MAAPTTSCDIFCRVVDNFGDAAVCWRLARQLTTEFNWRIRLIIDAPSRLDTLVSDSARAGVAVIQWLDELLAETNCDVVIEAFGCALPQTYVRSMARRASAPVWINLEYLTAEPWVCDCHGLPSPQSSSRLVKYFYFPGFDRATGGIMREHDYAERRERFDATAFCEQLGIPYPGEELLVSYFAYPRAPFAALLEAMAQSKHPVRLLVPGGGTLPASKGNLRLQPIPFLNQHRYDELLWLCDVNFVRGEDSFVRAQLAGKPFIWNIYAQAEAAHLVKLDAFLDRYLSSPAATPEARHQAAAREYGRSNETSLTAGAEVKFRALWHAWNEGRRLDWCGFLQNLDEYRQRACSWADFLSTQDDLAQQLVAFCAAMR